MVASIQVYTYSHSCTSPVNKTINACIIITDTLMDNYIIIISYIGINLIEKINVLGWLSNQYIHTAIQVIIVTLLKNILD